MNENASSNIHVYDDNFFFFFFFYSTTLLPSVKADFFFLFFFFGGGGGQVYSSHIHASHKTSLNYNTNNSSSSSSSKHWGKIPLKILIGDQVSKDRLVGCIFNGVGKSDIRIK